MNYWPLIGILLVVAGFALRMNPMLVVTGSALGYFVNPVWIGLAAFVGAGLTFAGITDTCGMGLILARMPWNQVAASSPSNMPAGSNPSDSKPCPPKSNSSCCG